jgi:hypothetical protein
LCTYGEREREREREREKGVTAMAVFRNNSPGLNETLQWKLSADYWFQKNIQY